MATISTPYESTETIDTTEWDLARDAAYAIGTPTTDDDVYQGFIDFSALQAGDEYVVKLYEKVTAAGTQIELARWSVAYGTVALLIPSLMLKHGWAVTVTKVAGTARLIGWSFRTAAA